jgi:hypothetical protein
MDENVRYELDALAALIRTGVAEPPYEINYSAGYQERSLEAGIQDAVARIKNSFLEEAFAFTDEGHLARYIRYQQLALTELIDGMRLIGYGDPYYDPDAPFYCADYSFPFEELLSFLQIHFTKYFDLSCGAPMPYFEATAAKVANWIEELKEKFTERQADQEIMNIALWPLDKFLWGASRELTYRRISYIKELLKSLKNVAEMDLCGRALTEELRNVLYYLNYNSTKFFGYCTRYINISITSDTTRETIEKLYFVLKQINQAPVKPSLIYKPQAPSLKCQLTDYITEEINYLENLKHPSTPLGPAPEILFTDFKLKFNLSVPQLAFLMKVLMDTNVIQNKNAAEVLRFISHFGITKHSENISISSFRSKFYDVEGGTRESLGEVVRLMTDYIGTRSTVPRAG